LKAVLSSAEPGAKAGFRRLLPVGNQWRNLPDFPIDPMALKATPMRVLCDLIRDRRANVAIIFALALVPLAFLVGVGVDYTVAADRQAQLNAFADAAVLAAVTPTMMAQSDSTAQAAAQNTFNAQANALSGVTYSANNLTVSVNTTAGGTRTASVTYTAASPTFFSSILATSAINLSGSSTAKAGLPPNIDFYLLLDSSPSMAIGATPTDIQSLINLTANENSAYKSCGFGCHEQNPTTNSGLDLYQVARNNNLTLRIDLLRQAAQNLMTTAQNTENTTNAQYRMAIYTFDVGFNTIQTLTSSLTTAQSSAGNISLLEVYQNNWLTSTNNNSDTDTNFDNAFNQINTTMPNPGSGTNANGDTPQEVLFLVTDGVEDEAVSKVSGSCPSLQSSQGNEISLNSSTCRQQSLTSINPDWCTTIKNKGIRIAVLYTVYSPIPSNSWYTNHVSPFQPNIGPTLETCASPGLYFAVQSGGDISAALSTLFELAVQSAYLAK
jgi:Flp pilus assembly protein TadG